MKIPLNTWLMHRHSQSIFKVTRINVANVETVDIDGMKGYTNRDILETALDKGKYVIDPKGSS